MTAMVEVQNVNTPGKISRVNAAKYADMHQSLLAVLPKVAPGFTQSEMIEAVKPHLSDDLFPKGKTSAWWVKTVQLDLEAKGKITRVTTKPLRWHWS